MYDQIDMNEAHPMPGHKWSHSWEPKTLKPAKMAFIGQETVRKQQRHNFLWGMYSLIAVFEHFNPFIDLKINFHLNPYNLASRLLWFWAPCVRWTSLAGVRKIPHVSNAFEDYTITKNHYIKNNHNKFFIMLERNFKQTLNHSSLCESEKWLAI